MIKPTPEAIAQAKQNPGGLVLVVDNYSGPENRIPNERILGWWRVDRAGNILGELVPNPKYKPIDECN